MAVKTVHLTAAKKEVDKLVNFLEKREWERTHELSAILENAEVQIEDLIEKAISTVLAKLQGTYSKEAKLWAENKMTDVDRKPVKITASERVKAQTEYNKISRTVRKLYDILGEE